NEYIALADHLSSYAVKLLDKVRGHKELDCVLGKTGKETEEKYFTLARLDLAIKYQEKPFVAHSNCQQKLIEIWHTGIRKIFKLNQLIIFSLIFVYIILWPFICVMYICASWSKRTNKIQQFLKQPCIKFLSHIISYVIFIVFIIVSSLLFASELKQKKIKLSDYNPNISMALQNSISQCKTSLYNCTYIPEYSDFYFRKQSPTWSDVAISIFVIGFLWHEIKQIYIDGIKDYLLSWNNIVDSCMNILYLSSFALKYYVFIEVTYALKRLSQADFQDKVSTVFNSTPSKQMDVWYTFYWLNADRFYWVPFDPVNVGEGFFAIANIFSLSRICFLLPAFQHLGPLQISLGRMMSDIGKFIIIFMIIFCAFMIGLNNLFWYYSFTARRHVQIGTHNLTIDNNRPFNAEKFFGTLGDTFKTVFWSLFGLSEKEGVLLGAYHSKFTEIIGYLIYGAFNIASVIVLLNMLIAMMSKSYETIEEHADVEWKFARSKLYMEYIKEGATLPVPFNIIPTPKSLYYLYQKIIQRKKLRKRHQREQQQIGGEHFTQPDTFRQPFPQQNGHDINGVRNSSADNNSQIQTRRISFEINRPLTYRKVMERVVKRFLLHKQREEQAEIREGDFEELKQDVQMLRFEMMNRLDETKEELLKTSSLLNDGVMYVCEQLTYLNTDINPNGVEQFQTFKQNMETNLVKSFDSGMDDVTTTRPQSLISDLNSSPRTLASLNITSMPNLNTNDSISCDLISSLPILHTSHSQPTLLTNDDDKNNLKDNLSDDVSMEKSTDYTHEIFTLNPIQIIKVLSPIRIHIIEPIAEENSDDLDNDINLRTISTIKQEEKNNLQISTVVDITDDTDIEIDASEHSCQTSDHEDAHF
ncbi:unnamed protein product, partial [Didymodactylos carnosus]